MALRRRHGSITLEVVMTVMSDLMFQLLVFTLLLQAGRAGGGMHAVGLDSDVELPPGRGKPVTEAAAPQVILTVMADRTIWFDGHSRTTDELRRIVSETCKNAVQSYVLIRCDGRVELKSLMALQGMLQGELKVKKVEFAVSKGETK